jgi:hypothetical protein
MDHPHHLQRHLRLFDATALVVGSMIGSGIFFGLSIMAQWVASATWTAITTISTWSPWKVSVARAVTSNTWCGRKTSSMMDFFKHSRRERCIWGILFPCVFVEA